MYPTTDERIENNFAYHAPTGNKAEKHETIRAALKVTAYQINALTPYCREQSKALEKIEEAMMWANAAIARYPEVSIESEKE